MAAASGRQTLWTVPVVIALCWMAHPAAAQYGGGSGTPDDPYQIWTAEQMDAIGADPNDWDKHFKLMADIDLSAYPGNSFHPIGSRWGPLGNWPYSGVFDGDGHTITNYSYSSDDTYPVGLFGYVSGIKAEVTGLHLIHATVEAPKAGSVGALIGYLETASVTDCSAADVLVTANSSVGGLVGMCAGNVSSCSCAGTVQGDFRVGGLAGYTEERWVEVWDGWMRRLEVGAVTGCHFEGAVTGRHSIGGLVGYNEAAVTSCDTAGTVAGQNSAGGLVGYNDDLGQITACWSTAAVNGAGQPVAQFAGDSAGGFVGSNSGDITGCWASGQVEADNRVGGFAGAAYGAISHCRASGAVQGRTNVGGFAGYGWNAVSFSYSTGRVSGDENVGGFAPDGSAYLCYWDTQTSGIEQGGAGRGRTTAQMTSAATFAGWGHESQWVIAEGVDYPRLVWENTGGELLVDAPRVYGGGAGEPNDPYRIDTAEHLITIGYYCEDFDKHFLLTSDLDFNSVDANDFIPLVVNGSFNGGGHCIHNFRYTPDASNAVGLFAGIGRGASVWDLHLASVHATGVQDVGALVGHNSGQVRDCSVTGTVGGTHNVGGLIGYNDGQVQACRADVVVSGVSCIGILAGRNAGRIEACNGAGQALGESSVGGLVGWNDTEIVSSWSAADVTGEEQVGGLVGTTDRARFWLACPSPPPSFVPGLADSRIIASYSMGRVAGRQSLGGLIGKNAGIVLGCYAACPVEVLPIAVGPISPSPDERSVQVAAAPDAAAAKAGGLVGENEYGIVHLSYWDVQRSGMPQSAGGRGRTTAEMTDPATFRGWSQLDAWSIEPGHSYPYFESPDGSGELLTDDPQRYGGGTGTTADPYQIRTPQQWLNLGYYSGDWDKHFVLTNDLDLSGVDPNAVWSVGIPMMPFAGVFNGGGHTIANFTLHRGEELYVGMFGCIGVAPWYDPGTYSSYGYVVTPTLAPGADPPTIASLHLANADVLGGYHVGGIVAYGDSYGIVSACSVTGRITATGTNAGGLVGYSRGAIQNCSSDCRVTADRVAGEIAAFSGGPVTFCSATGAVRTVGERNSYAGGLVGESSAAVRFSHFAGDIIGVYTAGGLVALNQNEVLRCSARATVTGTYLLGGLVGYNEYGGTIRESFADGAVTGGNTVGGLVGHSIGAIVNCFAAGQVSGDDRVGGLVGDGYREIRFCYSTCRVSGGTLVGGFMGELQRWGNTAPVSCFWDIDSSATLDGVASAEPDPNGVTGLPTASMQTSGPFLSTGWDFVNETSNGVEDIWQIPEGQGYPRLWWETASDPNRPEIAADMPQQTR